MLLTAHSHISSTIFFSSPTWNTLIFTDTDFRSFNLMDLTHQTKINEQLFFKMVLKVKPILTTILNL